MAPGEPLCSGIAPNTYTKLCLPRRAKDATIPVWCALQRLEQLATPPRWVAGCSDLQHSCGFGLLAYQQQNIHTGNELLRAVLENNV